MKRSALQCAVGFIGATLIVVGVVWTCHQLSTPTQLNAAQPASVSAPQQLQTKRQSGSLSLSLSSDKEASRTRQDAKPQRVASTNKIRPTSGALSLAVVEPEASVEVESLSNDISYPDAFEQLDEMDNAPEEFVNDTIGSFPETATPTPFPNVDVISTPNTFDAYAEENAAPSREVYDSSLRLGDDDIQDDFPGVVPTAIEPLDEESYTPSEDAITRLDSLSNFDSQEETPVATAPQELTAPARELPQVENAAPLPTVDQYQTNAVNTQRAPIVESTPLNNSANLNTFSRSEAPSNAGISAELLQYVSETAASVATPNEKLDGVQTFQIVVEKLAPEEVTLGKQTTIVVSVKNQGANEVKNLILRDSVPEGAQFVSSAMKIVPNAQGELLWPKFDLPAKSEKKFEYTIVPMREGVLGGVASVMIAASASCQIKCTRPELKVEVTAPSEVELGQPVTLNIVISNIGSGVAESIKLNETIPEGLSHPDGTVLMNDLGVLNAGESKRLPLSLQTVAAGVAVNQLTVTADGCETQQVETPVKVVAPELKLGITGPENVYLERAVEYKLSVKNIGESSAYDVKLIAKLPEGVQFVKANNLGAYRENEHSVYWDLAELPAQLDAEISLSLQTTKAAQSELVFSAVGPNGVSAHVNKKVAIDGLAALSFNVSSSTDLVEVGKEFEYSIQIENRGTKASNNVVLQILPPEAIKILATDGPTNARIKNGVIVFDKINSIPAKAHATYVVKASPNSAGDCRVEFQLSSDDLEPLTKEENTRVYQ